VHLWRSYKRGKQKGGEREGKGGGGREVSIMGVPSIEADEAAASSLSE